jgi:WD repeat-containing protein 22
MPGLNIADVVIRRQMGVAGGIKGAAAGRLDTFRWLYSKDLYAHYGCVNTVEFDPSGRWMASGGDDRRVLVIIARAALGQFLCK